MNATVSADSYLKALWETNKDDSRFKTFEEWRDAYLRLGRLERLPYSDALARVIADLYEGLGQ